MALASDYFLASGLLTDAAAALALLRFSSCLAYSGSMKLFCSKKSI